MIFDDLKSYLQDKIDNDDDISSEIKIGEQYQYGVEPNPPEILLQIVDNTENYNGTVFEGEKVSTVLLQVIIMTGLMKIANKKYNAQKSCNILSDKVHNWFNKIDMVNGIENIINCRRIQWSTPFPYETGTKAYYSILRFQLDITK